MKKRDKKLVVAKETLYELEEGKDMKSVLGGAQQASCTMSPSTAGGSIRQCC